MQNPIFAKSVSTQIFVNSNPYNAVTKKTMKSPKNMLQQLVCVLISALKGKLGKKNLLAQSFYRPQTKRSLNRQFSPKSPEVGQKSR